MIWFIFIWLICGIIAYLILYGFKDIWFPLLVVFLGPAALVLSIIYVINNPIREIKSKDGTLHFKRWRIISTKWFSVFVHLIAKEDGDEYLHDHPWNFSSLILSGGYKEQYATSIDEIGNPKTRDRKPFSFRHYDAYSPHKVIEVFGRSYSLVFVGRRFREWGYQKPDGSFMTNKEYRNGRI